MHTDNCECIVGESASTNLDNVRLLGQFRAIVNSAEEHYYAMERINLGEIRKSAVAVIYVCIFYCCLQFSSIHMYLLFTALFRKLPRRMTETTMVSIPVTMKQGIRQLLEVVAMVAVVTVC